MRQLTFIGPGAFEWRDVPMPVVGDARHAVVRPLAVARCDLDLYIATGVAPFPGPFAFGHEMVGEVVDAGEAAGVVPGQRVVVPFQISCGSCVSCLRGFTASCTSVPRYAAYGLGGDFGGALSDGIFVPFADHMLVPLPDGVGPVVAASAADNIVDGWRAVAPPLAEEPGARVLVVGGWAQSVGLYAAGAAVALGAAEVLYLDDDSERRSRAQAMGATAAPLALDQRHRTDAAFPIVVEAAGQEAGLGFAIRSCAPDGVVTSVSMHFGKTTAIPLAQAYRQGLTFKTSRASARPWLPDVLGCIACGRLHPEHVTHRVLPFADAGDAMTDPGPKLVFTP